jgi:hypothetical protein
VSLHGNDIALTGFYQHVASCQTVKTVTTNGLHGFQRTANLVRYVLVEDAGTLVEVFRYRDEAFDISARVHNCVGICPHSSLIHQFFVRKVRSGGPEAGPAYSYNGHTFIHVFLLEFEDAKMDGRYKNPSRYLLGFWVSIYGCNVRKISGTKKVRKGGAGSKNFLWQLSESVFITFIEVYC